MVFNLRGKRGGVGFVVRRLRSIKTKAYFSFLYPRGKLERMLVERMICACAPFSSLGCPIAGTRSFCTTEKQICGLSLYIL